MAFLGKIQEFLEKFEQNKKKMKMTTNRESENGELSRVLPYSYQLLS